MTEQKFTHTLEEAANAYYDAAGFKNEHRFSTSAGLANGYLREGCFTIAEIFERSSGQTLGSEYLATIIVRQEMVTKRIPDNTFRFYFALQTQKEIGEIEQEILKSQIAPLLGVEIDELKPISPLEERKRNLENLKQMLLAQPAINL